MRVSLTFIVLNWKTSEFRFSVDSAEFEAVIIIADSKLNHLSKNQRLKQLVVQTYRSI